MQFASQSNRTTAQSRRLLPSAIGVGIVLFYVLFTLLPNSNSLMVKWPWVFIWQFGLILGPIAILFQLWQQSFRKLGHRLDWLAGAWCLVLVLSAAFSEFSHQAFWYSWAAICGIAFLYALNTWLNSANKVRLLLTFQGGLSVLFSGLSLIAWFFQTVRPHLQMLQELKSYGIERSLEFQSIPLRNWHPLGHQNYVAGYLILTLPLLIGLAFSQRGWQRVGWLCGFALSLATLYSTASRAGWLSLIMGVSVFLSLSAWQYPKLRKTLLASGLTSLGVIALWGFSSDRIRGLFASLGSQGEGGEFFYRAITNTTGWLIGLDHPIFGTGLGNVTLLYQKYRPDWAGREAELTYQLHSTPAQLWAELGLAGALLIVASLIAITYLSLRRTPQMSNSSNQEETTLVPLRAGTISGLSGYIIYAITDYQLDNICISGTIIIFVAILIFDNRQLSISDDNISEISYPIFKRLALAGTGLLVAISIWLYPIHRAWMFSSQGFLALQQKDIASFVTYLEHAHKLTPWEPYYPYQLGWNLGELAFHSTDTQQQETFRKESVQWFEKAITLSPNREFGYSNLGWLQVNSRPHQATQNFVKATKLIPEKEGAFFALGYSLLQEGQSDLACQAMVLELLQHPLLFTSPIWQSSSLSSIYAQVLSIFRDEITKSMEDKGTDLIAMAYKRQVLESLQWWLGEFDNARETFDQSPTQPSKAIFPLAEMSSGKQYVIDLEQSSTAYSALIAWQNPSKVKPILRQAELQDTNISQLPSEQYLNVTSQNLQESISQSTTFHQWITEKSPTRQRRNQRLGFGVISRHIDGPIPTDFSLQIKNMVIETLLPQGLLQSNHYLIDTDQTLAKRRQLYRQISEFVAEESA